MTGDHTFGLLASINPGRWDGWKTPQGSVATLKQHQREHPLDTRVGKKPILLERTFNKQISQCECKAAAEAVWVVSLSALLELDLAAAVDKVRQIYVTKGRYTLTEADIRHSADR